MGEGELQLQYEDCDNDSRRLQNAIDNDLSYLVNNTSWVQHDINTYHQQLTPRVRRLVSDRKQVLLQQLNLVEKLNIPVRRRESLPKTYAVPTIKRKPKIERPAVASGLYKPELALAMEEYEYILKVADNMSVMMERSPATFAKLKEEEIRDHFLLALNAQFEGQATGETFNQEGKTDIIIKADGRNVFIAECKFWEGPTAFPACVDQLLSYTCWRDTKTAIFLFNRNRNMSRVLGSVHFLSSS